MTWPPPVGSPRRRWYLRWRLHLERCWWCRDMKHDHYCRKADALAIELEGPE